MSAFLGKYWQKWMPEPNSGCFLWLGATNGRYGHVAKGNCHRIVCEEAHGAAPEKATASHKCGVPLCVNPDHLIWETLSVNHARKTDEKRRSGGSKKRFGTLKGAFWSASNKKWYSEIRTNGVRRHLGYFGSEWEAHCAYERARVVGRGGNGV